MSRITDAQILYFDPSVTYIAPLKDKLARPKLKAYRQAGEEVKSGLTVYALPPVLPFFNQFRWINRLNQRRIARYVRKRMHQHGMDDAVLWVYSPVTVDCVDHIPHSSLVYDCVDRHSAYGGLMNPALVDAMEMELASKCDQVFATAQGLADRLRKANPHTEFIPNGANFERFVQAAGELPCPEDMKDIPKPVFGFVGALQECIEYGFLEHAAKSHPEWSFVFIGRENAGVDLSKLRAMNNCHFLGLKPNEQLPAYIRQFDACLNLFASGDLSKDVSPLKFYEYLATGKPIVSTPQPDQVLQYRPLIHIASDAEAFCTCCSAAMADTDPDRTSERIEEGRKSSWDSRVAEMTALLEKRGVF